MKWCRVHLNLHGSRRVVSGGQRGKTGYLHQMFLLRTHLFKYKPPPPLYDLIQIAQLGKTGKEAAGNWRGGWDHARDAHSFTSLQSVLKNTRCQSWAHTILGEKSHYTGFQAAAQAFSQIMSILFPLVFKAGGTARPCEIFPAGRAGWRGWLWHAHCDWMSVCFAVMHQDRLFV